MNNFSQIDGQSEFRAEMTLTTDDLNENDEMVDNDDPNEVEGEEDTHYYPGDGLGTDDLEDYNHNEADDYRNEGWENWDGDSDGSVGWVDGGVVPPSTA